MTNGFTPEQVESTLLRDGGLCCLWGTITGCQRQASTANHRRNRQAGGSKLRNGMANACAICWFCNGAIESEPLARAEAVRLGVKLEEDSERDASTTPMWSPWFGQWVTLSDEALRLTGIVDYSLDARTMSVRGRP